MCEVKIQFRKDVQSALVHNLGRCIFIATNAADALVALSFVNGHKVQTGDSFETSDVVGHRNAGGNFVLLGTALRDEVSGVKKA